MKVEIKNPKTGEIKIAELRENTSDIFEELESKRLSDDMLVREINDMPFDKAISQDAKIKLDMIKDLTLKIGDKVLNVGRKILECIIVLYKNYPKTAVGLVIGTVAGIVFSSIPILGWALGWIVAPLCALFGLGAGFWMDMQEISLKRQVEAVVNDTFGGLKDTEETF